MSRTRLANKTIWSLEDCMGRLRAIRRALRRAVARAREQMDAVMLGALLEMSQEVGELERQLRDARKGEYLEDQEK